MNDSLKKWCVLVASGLLLLNGCSSSVYPPPLFERKVDVSKVGVVYDADFSVPYNGTFAPRMLEFGIPHTQYELMLQVSDTVPGRLEREDKEAEALIRKTGTMDMSHISLWKVIGSWGDADYFGKLNVGQLKTHVRPMKYPGAPIMLKITLTPHPGTRKPIEYVTARDSGTGRRGIVAPELPLEITLNLSTFAQDGNSGNSSPQHKLLLLFPNLELHGDYRLRVENLTPITLPTGIETILIQRVGRISK